MRRFATMTMLAAAALMLAYGFAGISSAEEEKADLADGKALFEASKCNMCHAVKAAGIEAKVKSEKMQGPDLTGLGSRFEADWVVKYLRKEVQLEEKDHKGTFKGSEDDVKAIMAWLDGLSAE
jgi:mono/diheme cytochrome c family protein